ncbi:MAG: type II toxin-antitoxin system HicA family toxin [Methylorubrum populi]
MSHRKKETRDLIARLRDDGWIVARKGPGDHVPVQTSHEAGGVTLDTGRREQAPGTLRSIDRQAGWDW